jgi:GNAT superfamily N-acetyltransferase
MNFEIRIGYRPGLIGRVCVLHAVYYAREWNFGHVFEAGVAAELADFIERHDPSMDRIWTLDADGDIEGSIAIQGSRDGESRAWLRWFIVSDRLKGKGAGRRLVERAVSFSREAGFEKVSLWTFQGLSAARHLYGRFGFRQVEEKPGSRWGRTVNERRFELDLTAS